MRVVSEEELWLIVPLFVWLFLPFFLLFSLFYFLRFQDASSLARVRYKGRTSERVQEKQYMYFYVSEEKENGYHIENGGEAAVHTFLRFNVSKHHLTFSKYEPETKKCIREVVLRKVNKIARECLGEARQNIKRGLSVFFLRASEAANKGICSSPRPAQSPPKGGRIERS